MLVPFDAIQRVNLSQAATIDAAISGFTMGPLSGVDGRPTLYDPTWGYFIFGQSLKVDYHDTQTYMDRGEFVISGIFTITAENATAGDEAADDDATFLRCVAKYDALVNLFKTKALATAPADYALWGTADDPRLIPLPVPLRGPDDEVIYGLPGEINVEPGQWGRFIRYRATLKEAKFPSAKVVVNGVVIDGATVNINCPRPLLERIPMMGCVGEVIQVKNYAVLEVEVDGTISGVHASGRSMNDYGADFIESLSQSMNADIGVVRIVGTDKVTEIHWPAMALDEGSNVELHHAEQVAQVNIKAKAST